MLHATQGPVAEQVLLLENVGTSVQVGPSQLPSLHKLLVQAASTLQLAGNCPDLYVRQSPTPNAYTLAIAGRKPFVVSCSVSCLPRVVLQSQYHHSLEFVHGRAH